MTGRQDKLDELTEQIRACRVCRDNPEFGGPLPHEPRPVLQVHTNSRICVVGQAPGTKVHVSGRPFTDPSGDRLRDWMGVTNEEFYDSGRIAIIPMGFCFPGLDAKGGDLPPRKECAPLWRARLMEALGDVALLLVIGQYAHAYHLGKKRKRTLTDTVSAWQEMYDPDADQRVMPMPHPSWRNNAWIKKNPWFEAELLPVLRTDIRQLLD